MAQRQGSARLRDIKLFNPVLWAKLERTVGANNAGNHARGGSTPNAFAVAVYEHHAQIKPTHWLSPKQLVEAGIVVATSAEPDEHEPHAGPCGGGE